MGVDHKPGTRGLHRAALDARANGKSLGRSQVLPVFEKAFDAMLAARKDGEVSSLLAKARIELIEFGPGLNTKITMTGDASRFGPELTALLSPAGTVTLKDLVKVLESHAEALESRNANRRKGDEQVRLVRRGWQAAEGAANDVRAQALNFLRDDGQYSSDELLTLLGTATQALTQLRSAKEVLETARQVWSTVLPRIPPEDALKSLTWDAPRMSPSFNRRFGVNNGKVTAPSVTDLLKALLAEAEAQAAAVDFKGYSAIKKAEAASRPLRKAEEDGGH